MTETYTTDTNAKAISEIKKQAKALNITDDERKVLKNTWYGLNKRCSNPKVESYQRYGARGIKVYPEWIKTEDNPDASSKFLLWVMGPDGIGTRPEGKHPSGFTLYSIDRINNDGNYEPGNLRWSTSEEQVNNSTGATPVTVNGTKFDSIKAAAYDLEMNYGTAASRNNSSKGLTNDPIRTVNREPIMYKGVTYPSLKNLCDELGCEYGLVFNRYRMYGWTLEDAINIRPSDYMAIRRRNELNGTVSPGIRNYSGNVNVTQAAREAGVSRSAISDKVYRQGMSLQQAMDSTRHVQKVVYNGVVYDNFKEACRLLGKSYSTGNKHIGKGYTPEQYLSGESALLENPTFVIDDHAFTNIRTLTRFYGIDKLVEKAEVKNEDVVEFVLKHREDNPDLFVAKGISFKTKRMQRQLNQGSASLYVYVGKGDDYELLAKPDVEAVDKVVNAIVEGDLVVTSKLETMLIKSKVFFYGVAEAIVVETAGTTYYLVANFDIKK